MASTSPSRLGGGRPAASGPANCSRLVLGRVSIRAKFVVKSVGRDATAKASLPDAGCMDEPRHGWGEILCRLFPAGRNFNHRPFSLPGQLVEKWLPGDQYRLIYSAGSSPLGRVEPRFAEPWAGRGNSWNFPQRRNFRRLAGLGDRDWGRWYTRTGSNRRPIRCKRTALPLSYSCRGKAGSCRRISPRSSQECKEHPGLPHLSPYKLASASSGWFVA